MAVDYNKLAANQYDPGYNQKIVALKNQLADQMGSYDKSKIGINTNYNNQVDTQNRNSITGKNNFSNNVLGRGIARSSIATSGLGEMDLVNNRLVNTINTGRTGALNDVENSKTAAQKAYGTTVAGLNSDRLAAISDLARQLKQTDVDNAYRQQQLAQEKELAYAQMRASAAAQRASLAASRSSAYNSAAADQADNIKGWKTGILGIINDSSLTNEQKIQELNAQRQAAGVNFEGSSLKNINGFIDGYLKQMNGKSRLAMQRAAAQKAASQKSYSSRSLLNKMTPSQQSAYNRSSIGSKLSGAWNDTIGSLFKKSTWSNLFGKY